MLFKGLQKRIDKWSDRNVTKRLTKYGATKRERKALLGLYQTRRGELRQGSGRRFLYSLAGGAVGASSGGLAGVGIARALRHRIGPIDATFIPIMAANLGTMIGVQAPNVHHMVRVSRKMARRSEITRKRLGIGGKPITAWRDSFLAGEMRLAHRIKKLRGK